MTENSQRCEACAKFMGGKNNLLENYWVRCGSAYTLSDFGDRQSGWEF
jgi:hypothetical protein